MPTTSTRGLVNAIRNQAGFDATYFTMYRHLKDDRGWPIVLLYVKELTLDANFPQGHAVVFAERVTVRGQVRLPGGRLHLLCRELVFEPGAGLDLTPEPRTSLPAAAHGVHAGPTDGKDGRHSAETDGADAASCVVIASAVRGRVNIRVRGGDGARGQAGGEAVNGDAGGSLVADVGRPYAVDVDVWYMTPGEAQAASTRGVLAQVLGRQPPELKELAHRNPASPEGMEPVWFEDRATGMGASTIAALPLRVRANDGVAPGAGGDGARGGDGGRGGRIIHHLPAGDHVFDVAGGERGASGAPGAGRRGGAGGRGGQVYVRCNDGRTHLAGVVDGKDRTSEHGATGKPGLPGQRGGDGAIHNLRTIAADPPAPSADEAAVVEVRAVAKYRVGHFMHVELARLLLLYVERQHLAGTDTRDELIGLLTWLCEQLDDAPGSALSYNRTGTTGTAVLWSNYYREVGDAEGVGGGDADAWAGVTAKARAYLARLRLGLDLLGDATNDGALLDQAAIGRTLTELAPAASAVSDAFDRFVAEARGSTVEPADRRALQALSRQQLDLLVADIAATRGRIAGASAEVRADLLGTLATQLADLTVLERGDQLVRQDAVADALAQRYYLEVRKHVSRMYEVARARVAALLHRQRRALDGLCAAAEPVRLVEAQAGLKAMLGAGVLADRERFDRLSGGTGSG